MTGIRTHFSPEQVTAHALTLYSETCLRRPLKGPSKRGLLTQGHLAGNSIPWCWLQWSSRTGGRLIRVVALPDFTVIIIGTRLEDMRAAACVPLRVSLPPPLSGGCVLLERTHSALAKKDCKSKAAFQVCCFVTSWNFSARQQCRCSSKHWQSTINAPEQNIRV